VDRNEIEIRADVTYGPVHDPIVDASANVCVCALEYKRPGLAPTLPAVPEHDARYVTFGRPATTGAVSVSGLDPRAFLAVTMHR
jgi:hypothetical protein